ncbi:MAG: class I SAM-dependent methyltransferase [Bacteroidales bacterium]|nr:class I SAM-dependent methyltransferase [Bacteroidales bacterium]
MENKALFFNERAALPESKSTEIIENLAIIEGNTILDIGSGGGYFDFLFAEKVGNNGKVICVDNNKDLLDFIDKETTEKQISNIETIHYDGENFPFQENSIDLVFMRNVTHHIKGRTNYFHKLSKILKQNGKIAVIDYKKGKLFSIYGLGGHFVRRKNIIFEMKKAGFDIEKEYNFLQKQIFIIFKPLNN